jgi:hypothetical protein
MYGCCRWLIPCTVFVAITFFAALYLQTFVARIHKAAPLLVHCVLFNRMEVFPATQHLLRINVHYQISLETIIYMPLEGS